jgi:hypothetical protein
VSGWRDEKSNSGERCRVLKIWSEECSVRANDNGMDKSMMVPDGCPTAT